jgi:hypothetical protein
MGFAAMGGCCGAWATTELLINQLIETAKFSNVHLIIFKLI